MKLGHPRSHAPRGNAHRDALRPDSQSRDAERLALAFPRGAWERNRSRRAGLTLFEVVIALAIFAGSMIPIYMLIFLASERALDVKMQARTSMLCQSKLAEVMIGAAPLQDTGGYSDYEGEKEVQWKLEPNEITEGLWQVKIWVRWKTEGGREMDSHLCRMVLDPAIRGSTFDEMPMGTPGTPTPNTDGSTTPSTTTK